MVFLGFLMSQNGLLMAEFVMCIILAVFAQQSAWQNLLVVAHSISHIPNDSKSESVRKC
jgi:hypothetical protein